MRGKNKCLSIQHFSKVSRKCGCDRINCIGPIFSAHRKLRVMAQIARKLPITANLVYVVNDCFKALCDVINYLSFGPRMYLKIRLPF
jgi:hypothetical protein